jgi:AAA+ ATPase superfamily predicted ATPase
MDNPFIIHGYKSPDYFCNRKEETLQLEKALKNGRNTVLLSLRRMGKTGLIKHLFHRLRKDKDCLTFYLDILNTESIDDFVNALSDTVLATSSYTSTSLFEKVVSFFKKMNPVITFDAISGTPSIELKPATEEQSMLSISQIFQFLEQQPQKVFIAIDEFQQITSYTDHRFEAFLRSHIQHLTNVSFVFSGSQEHILTTMFTSYSRPFYQSSDFLKLDRISQDTYVDFVQTKFRDSGKDITREQIMNVLDWLDTYTFYVQSFFNKLWYEVEGTCEDATIQSLKESIINEHDYVYSNINKLITSAQYHLLTAIAKEGSVSQPSGQKFISKYQLGSPSTISSALKTLVDKEMIYKENDEYKVYDVFLSKWLAR